jgi:hypothetical protein
VESPVFCLFVLVVLFGCFVLVGCVVCLFGGWEVRECQRGINDMYFERVRGRLVRKLLDTTDSLCLHNNNNNNNNNNNMGHKE